MTSHVAHEAQIIFTVCLVSLLGMAYLYVMRVPLRGGYLGPVAVSVQQYKTNALGQMTAMVAITNGGSHTIRFGVGTQILQNSGWVDSVSGMSNTINLNLDPDPLIAPRAERIVSVAISPPTAAWRVYALCQKQYPEHWSTRLRWLADAYVLKRGVVEHIYSRKIQGWGAQPSDPPNDGPATPVDNSDASGGGRHR